MGVIYCLKNKLNGKRYIGQTVNLNNRMREHLSRSNRKGINQALEKYGFENFDLIIIEKNIAENKLSKKEKHWIKEFNTYKGEGYNLTPGGEAKRGKDNPMYGVSGEDHPNYGKESPLKGTTRSKEFCQKLSKALKGKMKGSDNPKAKASIEDAREILKERIKNSSTSREIAKNYDFSTRPVRDILRGEHWTIEEGNLGDLAEQVNSSCDKVTPEMRDRVLELREDGLTYKEISKDKKINVTYVVVGQICRREHKICNKVGV